MAGLMEVTMRPIDTWPDGWRTPRDRKPNPFRVTSYQATLDLLTFELERIGALAAHLQLDVQSGDIRRDGHLRANAKVGHPGVILTIDTRKLGVLTYPCDTFAARWSGEPPDWQINLRAIALGLEALRKVERYGIAERGEQYAGFQALPPARENGAGSMTVEEAARLLADAANTPGLAVDDPDAINAVWRQASKAHHPDAGGDPAVFRQLTEARDLLRQEVA